MDTCGHDRVARAVDRAARVVWQHVVVSPPGSHHLVRVLRRGAEAVDALDPTALRRGRAKEDAVHAIDADGARDVRVRLAERRAVVRRGKGIGHERGFAREDHVAGRNAPRKLVEKLQRRDARQWDCDIRTAVWPIAIVELRRLDGCAGLDITAAKRRQTAHRASRAPGQSALHPRKRVAGLDGRNAWVAAHWRAAHPPRCC